jgi:uncharacterized membrane protein
MDRSPEPIEARVARLERLIEELLARSTPASVTRDGSGAERRVPEYGGERATAQGGSAASGSPTEIEAREDAAAAQVAPQARSGATGAAAGLDAWRDRFWDGEFWLNKLGIGLVLFGITFLFLYSIEQGWLTPEVRVGFGAVVGAVLLLAGLRMGSEHRSLAQVLLGGGIGVFYIVGFAAFQLYALLGYHSAFALMVAVTVGAFWLAVREDHPILALIGIKGALGTPFLLYRGDGDVEWLVSYTAVVMASSVALFVHREWRSLVWTAAIGGWAVHLIGYTQSFAPSSAGTDAERWVMQSTIVFGWILFASVVPVREHQLSRGRRGESGAGPVALRCHLHLLAAMTPLAALGLTGGLWSISSSVWGWTTLVAAASYGAAAAVLRDRDVRLSDAQLFAAATLLVAGSIAAFGGNTLFAGLALQVLVVHLAARLTRSGWLSAVGHGVAISVAIWFIVRLDVSGLAGSAGALADPLAIAALLLASRELAQPAARRVYRGAVHLAVLAWLWRELSYLPGGAALVSGAWGAYAVGMLAVGARIRNLPLQKVAVVTILALVAKLFLVDLAALEAIWRILLFLGLGSVLLASSYALQGAWRSSGSVWSDP